MSSLCYVWPGHRIFFYLLKSCSQHDILEGWYIVLPVRLNWQSRIRPKCGRLAASKYTWVTDRRVPYFLSSLCEQCDIVLAWNTLETRNQWQVMSNELYFLFFLSQTFFPLSHLLSLCSSGISLSEHIQPKLHYFVMSTIYFEIELLARNYQVRYEQIIIGTYSIRYCNLIYG